jgi:hypothetical protein
VWNSCGAFLIRAWALFYFLQKVLFPLASWWTSKPLDLHVQSPVAGKANGRIDYPAVWQHQNRDALNEAHFDFFELLWAFFFAVITLLLLVMLPTHQNNGALQMNVE